jgi:hypothetical protein
LVSGGEFILRSPPWSPIGTESGAAHQAAISTCLHFSHNPNGTQPILGIKMM